MNHTAREFKKALDKHLIIDDWQAVDCILAVMAAHYVPGDPIWFRIIGISGSGKSELLSAAKDHADCAKLETLTPGSIRRGYIPKDGAVLDTMLSRINGKLVITKEMAGMLTADRDARTEVFGLLRSVYDGEIVSDYGSDQGHIEQRTKFDWIAASTAQIDQHRNLESLLGSRFVDLRWSEATDTDALLEQAEYNDSHISDIRRDLSDKMHDYLNDVREYHTVNTSETYYSDDDKAFTRSLVQTATVARGIVQRNNRGEVIAVPGKAETGTRFIKFFSRFVHGLRVLGVDDLRPYLVRLAFDAMPPQRTMMVRAVLAGHTTRDAIAEHTRLSAGTVSAIKDDMDILGASMSVLCDTFAEHVRAIEGVKSCSQQSSR